MGTDSPFPVSPRPARPWDSTPSTEGKIGTVVLVRRKGLLYRSLGFYAGGKLVMVFQLKLTCACGATKLFESPENDDSPFETIINLMDVSGWKEKPGTGKERSGTMEGTCPKCGGIVVEGEVVG